MTTQTDSTRVKTVSYDALPRESTFAVGGRLLAPELRRHVYRLYYVLRTLDDLVDEDDPRAPERIDAVERWAHDEASSSPEVSVLQELSEESGLSRAPLVEFCAAMRQDIARTPIQTDAELERYCHRAGGAVGVMLAQIFSTTHPEGETLMATLGRAAQRTNILRDIDEDAAHQRLYIPTSTIERFGQPRPGARTELLRDQITRADALYEEGLAAIPLLHTGQRWMTLTAALYREILRQIEREGYGRHAGRARVPDWRRRLITTRCQLALPHKRESRFLASA